MQGAEDLTRFAAAVSVVPDDAPAWLAVKRKTVALIGDLVQEDPESPVSCVCVRVCVMCVCVCVCVVCVCVCGVCVSVYIYSYLGSGKWSPLATLVKGHHRLCRHHSIFLR